MKGNNKLDAWFAVIIVASYPILLTIAWLFRRRKPDVVWLPAIPVALILVSLTAH